MEVGNYGSISTAVTLLFHPYTAAAQQARELVRVVAAFTTLFTNYSNVVEANSDSDDEDKLHIVEEDSLPDEAGEDDVPVLPAALGLNGPVDHQDRWNGMGEDTLGPEAEPQDVGFPGEWWSNLMPISPPHISAAVELEPNWERCGFLVQMGVGSFSCWDMGSIPTRV
ncbi:zinc finger E-box-binding homeobox 1 [Arapaima gigas]